MSPRRIVIGGAVYEADDDALAELGKQGIGFADAPAGGEQPAQPAPESSIPATHSAARGFMHGATLGLYDAAIPGVGKSLPEVFGEEPYDQVRAAHPSANTVGDLVGAVASPVGKLGQAAKGAGLVARTVRGGLAGAGESAVRAAAEGGDVGQEAEVGGGVAAGLSAVSPALGRGVGALTDLTGKGAGLAADAMRSRAVGVMSKEAKALADRFGVSQLPHEIAALVERVSPSGWTGKSATTRAAELAGELKGTYGPKIDQVLQGAGVDAEVPGAWQRALNQLQGEVAGAPSGTAAERSYRSNLGQNVDELLQEPGPVDAVGLRGQKTRFASDAHSGPAGTVPDVGAKRASETQGQALHDALDHVMGSAAPADRAAFHQANKDYGERALLQQMAADRAAVEASTSRFPALVAAVGGGALGGMYGGPGGAALGAIGGLFTGTRNQAVQALETTRGLDALANLGRALEQQAPRVAQGARDVGEAVGRGATRAGNLVSDLLDPEEERY